MRSSWRTGGKSTESSGPTARREARGAFFDAQARCPHPGEQAEVDELQRRGVTARAFRVHGADYINMGATPYSKAHGRVFDFSGLIEEYGLAFVERVATTFVAVAENLAWPQSEQPRLVDFPHMAGGASGVLGRAADARRQPVDRREFVRVALLYQQEVRVPARSGTAGT